MPRCLYSGVNWAARRLFCLRAWGIVFLNELIRDGSIVNRADGNIFAFTKGGKLVLMYGEGRTQSRRGDLVGRIIGLVDYLELASGSFVFGHVHAAA